MPDAPAPAAPSPSPAIAAPEAAPIVAPVATPEAPPVVEAQPTLEEAIAAADITSWSDSKIKDLESGDPERINRALGITGTPKPAEAEAAKPAEAASEPKQIDGESLGRVSIKALKPEDRAKVVQALEMIRSGESPEGAFAKFFGAAPVAAPTPTPAAPEVAAPVSQDHPRVAELKGELATLEQQYQEAVEAYDPSANLILRKVLRAEMQLGDAQKEARAEQAHAEAWQRQNAIHHQRTMDKYSDLITDPESNFLAYCDDEILLAEAKKDPIMLSPDWSEKIAQRTKEKFFKESAVQNQPTERHDSPIPPAPKSSVRLPGSPVGPAFSAGAMSSQTAQAEFDALNPSDRIAVLAQMEELAKQQRR